MMNAIHRLEPLWWLLFGAGGFVAALLLPALVFGLGIAGAHGWISADYAMSFQRMHDLAANPLGRGLLTAIVSLTLWHSAHHLRHFALDMGFHAHESAVSVGLYALALAGTLCTVSLVAAL